MGQTVGKSPTKMITPSTASFKKIPELEHIEKLVEGGKVDMRLVTIALWKNRNDSTYIGKLCHELAKLIDEKPVLDQVEFYLPQLAHMVLHLETELPKTAIEQFVMLVSQSSVHFALQFFWIVYAALDENRPKRYGNTDVFVRCSQLLLTLEQCIVYGSPVALHAQTLDDPQSISKLEMEQIFMADRRFFAQKCPPGSPSMSKHSTKVGWLWKKGGGTSRMGRRSWNLRFCRIERRVLFIYSRENDIHARSVVPLDRAEINIIDNPKHTFYFEIHHKYSACKYKFKASNEEDLQSWVSRLKAEAVAPAPPEISPSPNGPGQTIADMSEDMRTFVLQEDGSTSPVKKSAAAPVAFAEKPKEHENRNGATTNNGTLPPNTLPPEAPKRRKRPSISRSWLNPQEQKRYDFFTQQRNFVKSITDICEDLREVEPPNRKEELKRQMEALEIPPNCFIPLCKSTDLFQQVLRPCAGEGRVFSTNERVPCLMYFEAKEDEAGQNVSCALYKILYGTNPFQLKSVGEEQNNKRNSSDAENISGSLPLKGTRRASTTCLQRALLEDTDRKARIRSVFGELWTERKQRIRSESQQQSEYWNLNAFIAKSNDDLRQEVFVMQLITYFHDVFEAEDLPLFLQPYRIMSTGGSTGLLEVVQNATSLDGLKKTEGFKNLRSHFEYIYGEPDTETFEQARRNFIHSLAAYSLVCYVLAIKDRHNGNILLDIDGCIVHIDFGFLLGRAPGGSFSIETAPFKLTTEMVDVIGGRESENFRYFTKIIIEGALAIRKNADTVYTLVEIMSYRSTLPCFQGNVSSILNSLKDRMFLNIPEDKVASTLETIIDRAYNHFGTNQYDKFQTFSNGIAK